MLGSASNGRESRAPIATDVIASKIGDQYVILIAAKAECKDGGSCISCLLKTFDVNAAIQPPRLQSWCLWIALALSGTVIRHWLRNPESASTSSLSFVPVILHHHLNENAVNVD